MTYQHPVRMGDRVRFTGYAERDVRGYTRTPSVKREQPMPSDPDALWTHDVRTGDALFKGWCPTLTCGRRSWQYASHGVPEAGRLCRQCFLEATE